MAEVVELEPLRKIEEGVEEVPEEVEAEDGIKTDEEGQISLF